MIYNIVGREELWIGWLQIGEGGEKRAGKHASVYFIFLKFVQLGGKKYDSGRREESLSFVTGGEGDGHLYVTDNYDAAQWEQEDKNLSLSGTLSNISYNWKLVSNICSGLK